MHRIMFLLSLCLGFMVTGAPLSPNPNAADQQLHHHVNSVPVDSLALRIPNFNTTKKYEIVLLVISASWESAERQEIRELWASEDESEMQKEGQSLVIFLVGRSDYLNMEADTYGDVLQVDVEEIYRNLVYKIEAGFRWVKERIQSDFVAKVDSDSVTHIDRLYRNLLNTNLMTPKAHWFVCSSSEEAQPIRELDSKWYVPESDYAPELYPRYCSGAGYAMKRTTFDAIVEKMAKHKVFEIEDAFFTGVVAQDLGQVAFVEGIVASQFTLFSECDEYGEPSLSILNIDGQFKYYGDTSTNLAAAWSQLKWPYCNQG